ncbi:MULTISPECIES: zf-HC2 domain-containing protein [unclassified Streptomyces]|uniref:zf-HC2 domain-containing protein n=1 Tax=unclassified Streptomyces TaxID=2593676 RepID=UPI00380CF397
MNAWHVSGALAARYASGAVPDSDAWSVEKHVEVCEACAGLVSAAVRSGPAGPVLTAVLADVRAVTAGRQPAEAAGPRVAARSEAGVPTVAGAPRPGPVARLVRAGGPALRGPWTVALLLVIAVAFGLALAGASDVSRPLLLALAPFLPVAGVALSYGRHADPMHEINASTPGGGLRLLLTRTAVVLAVSMPALTLAGALLPSGAPGPGAATWLLPGFALTLAVPALGSFLDGRTAAGIVSGGWALAVLTPVLRLSRGLTVSADALAHHLTLLSAPAAQSGWAAGAAVCAGLLVLRRRSFDVAHSGRRGHM